jgi:hypothetical protein
MQWDFLSPPGQRGLVGLQVKFLFTELLKEVFQIPDQYHYFLTLNVVVSVCNIQRHSLVAYYPLLAFL